MIVFLCFKWLIKDKPLLLSFCLTSYFYFLPKVCQQYTFNSIYITWSSKPIIYPRQLVINWCARVGTYNFSWKVLKPEILSLKENSFYIVHCSCNIMTYLILMLFYFLSTCLVIHIFNNLLFLCAVVAYTGKSSNVLFFINNYFRDLPFVVLLLLRPGDVETNLGSVISYQILSLEPKWSSCPWFPQGLLNRSFYYHSQLPYHLSLWNAARFHSTLNWWKYND